MAYYYKDGSGIDSSAYIYVQLQVTRTDYPTYSHFSVKSVAVSDTGSSSFIRGQVTTNQAGNSWTAATGWKSVSYNGTTTLATATFDVTRGASDKTARIGAYAEGGGTGIYAGGTDYAWLNVTVPKVLAPNAPTGCTATYVSDSQATVSWTNGTTDSNHPRDNTLVERRDGSNDWAQVASASGTASGYTDNGISPNTQYQYRVRAKNVAGYSAYSTSGSIYTTPAAPASVTLDKTAATTVQVDVTGTWGYAVTYDVESTYDGGSTWATVATSTSLPYSATVNAGTVQFRVRAVRGALSSAWTNSASLVTVCPPLAPTIVSAPSGSIANGSTATVSWTPNHPDGSAQASAEVKVTNPGGTSTTYTVSTATSYSFTPNATGTWTAQVRTKGLDPSYGEWSQTVSWGVANPPAVVITSPATDGTDVVSLPMTVSWSVTDSTGVSAQRIIIEGSDGEILNRTLAGDVRTVALNASDVALENGQTYTIRLRVMGGSGLVTEQTRIFDVAWLAPAAPVLQLTEGEGRSATIDVMDTHYSESGATIAVDGSAIADSFTVFGKSTQDGTPTPSAPVPIESVQSPNLQPFFSQDFSDTSYWFYPPFTSGGTSTDTTPTATQLSDGWAHVEWGGTVSRRQLTATTPVMPTDGSIKPSSTYTLMVEVRNFSATGTNAQMIFPATDGTKAPWTTNSYQGVLSDGMFLYTASTKADISAATQLRCFMVACNGVSTSTTFSLSFDIRMSLYEGAYFGRYAPVGNIQVRSTGRNLLKVPTSTFTSDYGILWTAGSGSVSMSGTDTGSPHAKNYVINEWGFFRIGNYLVYSNLTAGYARKIPAGTYTLSADVSDISGSAGVAASVGTTLGAYPSSVYQATASAPSVTFTVSEGDYVQLSVFYSGETVSSTVSDIQLELGSTATEYEPYQGTSTPIDLQGHALRSLPDGTRDELRVEGGSKVLVKRCEETQQAVTDGVTGTVGVDVLSSTGQIANGVQVVYKLAAPQEIDLGAVSDMPFIPEDGKMWVDGTEMEAVLRPADYAGQPTIESVDVQRVNADGTAWTVATGLTVGGSCIDPLPPLGVPVTYRATSSAASGSTASGEFTETFGGRDWVLNFGNAAQEHVEFIYNPQADLSLAQGGKGYHFADGGAGKGLPVFYPTTDRDYAGTLKFDTILYGDSDKVLDLCDRYPVAWLRDPFGHRWRAHVAPSVSHGVGQVWPVTLSWDAVRWTEAWDG